MTDDDSIHIEPLKHPVNRVIKIPGSKSITNRALLIAAASGGRCVIKNALLSDDTFAMINCLKKLGVAVKIEANKISVHGNLKNIKNKKYILNAGLSGTTMRFLLPLLTVIPGEKILKGKEGLNKRPIGDLVSALRKMGARISNQTRQGFPPLRIESRALARNNTEVSGAISSQYLSGLLMFLPVIGGGKIMVNGNLVSRPYVDLTIDVMGAFGVIVKNENYSLFEVDKDQKYKATEYTVEGDYSSADYFAAIAALTRSKITLENLNPKSSQGDAIFLSILEKMGNKVKRSENSVTVVGHGVSPVDIDMEKSPDQIQTLAVLASFAHGKTTIHGVKTLKVKETDRLKAVRSELKKMGIRTRAANNSLVVFGGAPHGASIETYKDHRMAMSFAIAGSKIPGVVIKDPGVVSKTFPRFWEELAIIR